MEFRENERGGGTGVEGGEREREREGGGGGEEKEREREREREREETDSTSTKILLCFESLTEVELGFVQTDVTVIEGEEVFLTTSFRNNVTSEDYYREFFTVSTRLNKGNATGESVRQLAVFLRCVAITCS